MEVGDRLDGTSTSARDPQKRRGMREEFDP